MIRRDLDQFIVGDVLYRALDGEVDRRGEQDRLVRAGRTHVVEMLGSPEVKELKFEFLKKFLNKPIESQGVTVLAFLCNTVLTTLCVGHKTK